MERLIKTGQVKARHARDIAFSRIGIGFEKLDRNVFDPEKAYDPVAALGVKWVRIQSGWARTEKEKGRYDFSWLDAIVDNLVSRGLKPWLCLCYGNGVYDEAAAKVFGAVGCPPIHSEEARAAWRAYVAATVARYRDRISHYEIWNEPDGQWCWKHGVSATEYGHFAIETAKAIRSAY
ncbi:MAG: beta-galactosidase, partial [Clostridiales bacterium]|nr:beta-galactosidase [Clostridiales bacterium]